MIRVFFFFLIPLSQVLATFADFVFDGFVADYLVQNKISDAREEIEDGIYHVRTILENLYRKLEV